MKEIALQDAKAQFGKIVAEALESPVIITRNGRNAAVLVPVRAPNRIKIVQGRRGATRLYEALRSAPGEVKPKRLRGKFRPAEL